MKRTVFVRLAILVTLLLMMLTPFVALAPAVLAQDVPSADTPTPEPATFTPTATAVPATNTPTPEGATATATAVGPTATPKPNVVPIPEPVTVVLFGTGLAALSAAVATRRGKNGKR